MYKNHKVFPINFQQQKPNSNKQAGMSALASKWVRLAPKETNLGHFKIDEPKSPRFVTFNLAQFEPKYDIPINKQNSTGESKTS